MNILETRAYRAAFIRYLRKGTSIELSLKAEAQPRTTLHYIWRTRSDSKVRASHAANNGKVFSWANPPVTGNPGEDYNCRCWAEPMDGEQYVRQTLITPVSDNPDKWGNEDFWNHYVARSGATVTLQETGYLQEVIDYFADEVATSDGSKGGYQAVENQIINLAKERFSGQIDYSFSESYRFGSFWRLFLNDGFFSLGRSVVRGSFDGDVQKETSSAGEYLVINGVITYEFTDEFSDPYERIERTQLLYNVTREEAERMVGQRADEEGVPYDINDSWKTKFSASVRIK